PRTCSCRSSPPSPRAPASASRCRARSPRRTEAPWRSRTAAPNPRAAGGRGARPACACRSAGTENPSGRGPPPGKIPASPGKGGRVIRSRSAVVGIAGIVLTGAWGAGGPARAQFIDKTVTGEVYHYQVVDHYCASATIQMLLDCTAVRSTNAYINTYLAAADP